MAKLTEPQKAYIVSRLACFYTPSEVVEMVTQDLGLKLDRQQIGKYDPSTLEGRKLSKDLKKLFVETRAKFQSDIQAIPIANRSVRLRELDGVLRRAGRNEDLRLRTLEQAAKEEGGVFTNRRELTGADNGPISLAVSGFEQALTKAYGDRDPEGSVSTG